MKLNEYQEKASSFAIYPDKHKIVYSALGLVGESGEVAGKIRKWLRGDDGEGGINDSRKEAIKDELGDVLWFLALTARDLDLNLEDIAQSNILKIQSRKERGTIMGDGDKR